MRENHAPRRGGQQTDQITQKNWHIMRNKRRGNEGGEVTGGARKLTCAKKRVEAGVGENQPEIGLSGECLTQLHLSLIAARLAGDLLMLWITQTELLVRVKTLRGVFFFPSPLIFGDVLVSTQVPHKRCLAT